VAEKAADERECGGIVWRSFSKRLRPTWTQPLVLTSVVGVGQDGIPEVTNAYTTNEGGAPNQLRVLIDRNRD
jgi:hypothetical protein